MLRNYSRFHAVLTAISITSKPGLIQTLFRSGVGVVEVRKEDKDEKECNLRQFVILVWRLKTVSKKNELYKISKRPRRKKRRFFLGPRTSGMNTYVGAN